MHIPHEGQKPELGTDWWWELHCCLGEGRGASKEHMELYKLFGAPRKTGKIISSAPETAHLCLQPSGTQSLHGQCSVPQNSHKFLWNLWGIKICWLPSSCQPLPPGIPVDCGMVALSVFLCRCAHSASRVPKHSFNSPPSNPHSAKAPSWNQRGHWCKNSLWFCSPPLKHRWAFPGWWRR